MSSDQSSAGEAFGLDLSAELSSEPPQSTEVSTSFRESKISIAVDVSGSTFGTVLNIEKQAINSVFSLIPRNLRTNITILPWNDQADRPRPLSDLNSLFSEGGTDPNSILEDPETRLVLQQSSFWFLMTDGEISEPLVRKFARSLVDYGMHGKACIISIFGERLARPSDCDISVGLSVFATSPHVAFLYTDIELNKTYILSIKGCFSALLPRGKKNPIFDYDTTWEDLVQTSYENLTRVSVPPPQELSKDEVALQGDSRLNMKTLLSQSTVNDDFMKQILLNEDNMKTVAITAKLRGESDKLEEWLRKVEDKAAMDEAAAGKPDKVAEPSRLLQDVTSKLSTDHNIRHQPSQSPQTTTPRYLTKSNTWHATGVMRTMSWGSTASASDNFVSLNRQKKPSQECVKEQRARATAPMEGSSLLTASFLKPTTAQEGFRGQCKECSASQSVLNFLLAPPSAASTQNFPAPGSLSKLLFPLTMGNYAETDIVSSSLVCDSCASSMLKRGVTYEDKTISAALPLVSFAKNEKAWLETINLATQKRFDRADLPLVFLAILYTKLEGIVSCDKRATDQQFRAAILWECNTISSQVVLQKPGIFGVVDHFGAGALQEVILRNFRDALNNAKSPLLLQYPMDGFIVANAALSNSRHKNALTSDKRKTIVFLRFLYDLTESCHNYAEKNGPVQFQAAKRLVTVVDNPQGPLSLFRWNSIRKLSGYFKDIEEFKKFLHNPETPGLHTLSISPKDLVNTPFLTPRSLADFRRLGMEFNWIESQAGHAIAVFMHHLLRMEVEDCPPAVQFQQIRGHWAVQKALADPAALSARAVEELTKHLPPLE